MTKHIHWVASAELGYDLRSIVRDFKKFTARTLIEAIEYNNKESSKEWMLSIFKNAGNYNSNNSKHQFWRQDNKPIHLKLTLATS